MAASRVCDSERPTLDVDVASCPVGCWEPRRQSALILLEAELHLHQVLQSNLSHIVHCARRHTHAAHSDARHNTATQIEAQSADVRTSELIAAPCPCPHALRPMYSLYCSVGVRLVSA